MPHLGDLVHGGVVLLCDDLLDLGAVEPLHWTGAHGAPTEDTCMGAGAMWVVRVV